MDRAVVALIARKEVRDAFRNRWFVLYSAGFAALALALSRLALTGAELGGLAGFGRTAATLVNLVLLIVPLMGLSLGSASIAQERESGTLATLLAQPISRGEVLVGKYVGLGLALSAALALGFGLAGLAVAFAGGTIGAGSYAQLVGLAVLLALAMLSVGLTISTLSSHTSTANGIALFAWLCFVFGGDLGLMGSSAAMHFDIQALFVAAAANPLDAFKIAAVSAITGGLDTLGPAGNYAVRTFGAWLQPLLVGVLAVWIALPLGVATAAFARRAVR